MPTEEIRFPSDLTYFRFVVTKLDMSLFKVYLDGHSRFSDGTPGDKYLGEIAKVSEDYYTCLGRHYGSLFTMCLCLYKEWKDASKPGSTGISFKGEPILPPKEVTDQVKGRQDAYSKDVVDRIYGHPRATVQDLYGTSDLLLLYYHGVTRIVDNVPTEWAIRSAPLPALDDLTFEDDAEQPLARLVLKAHLKLPTVRETSPDGCFREENKTLCLGTVWSPSYNPVWYWEYRHPGTKKLATSTETCRVFDTREEAAQGLYAYRVALRKGEEEDRVQAEGRVRQATAEETAKVTYCALDTPKEPIDERIKKLVDATKKAQARMNTSGIKFDPDATERWLRGRGFDTRPIHVILGGLNSSEYQSLKKVAARYFGVDVVEKEEKPSLAVRIDLGDFDFAKLEIASSLNSFASALVREFDIPGDDRERTNALRWKIFRIAQTLVSREGKEVREYLKILKKEYMRLRQVVIEGLGREERRTGKGKE